MREHTRWVGCLCLAIWILAVGSRAAEEAAPVVDDATIPFIAGLAPQGNGRAILEKFIRHAEAYAADLTQ